jgi:hypothetical protein
VELQRRNYSYTVTESSRSWEQGGKVGLLTNKSGRRFRTDLRSTLTARVTSVGGRKWKGREAAGGDKGNARKGLAAEVVERSGVKWAGLGCYDLTSGLGCRPFRVTEKLQGYRSHCTLGARPWRPAHLILLARPCPRPCPCPDNEFDLVWGGGVEGGGRWRWKQRKSGGRVG